ncbi:hypothetical protein VTH82DRAFT_6232 [Thermothelomyces myriococcoides]
MFTDIRRDVSRALKEHESPEECLGPLLTQGNPGMGKSIVAYDIYNDLNEEYDWNSGTWITYFAFDKDVESLQSIQNMLSFFAFEVAAKDPEYLANVLSWFQKDQDNLRRTESWTRNVWMDLFSAWFKGKRRLVMVLDDIDQLPKGQYDEFMDTYVAPSQNPLSILINCLESLSGEFRDDVHEEVVNLLKGDLSNDETLLQLLRNSLKYSTWPTNGAGDQLQNSGEDQGVLSEEEMARLARELNNRVQETSWAELVRLLQDRVGDKDAPKAQKVLGALKTLEDPSCRPPNGNIINARRFAASVFIVVSRNDQCDDDADDDEEGNGGDSRNGEDKQADDPDTDTTRALSYRHLPQISISTL